MVPRLGWRGGGGGVWAGGAKEEALPWTYLAGVDALRNEVGRVGGPGRWAGPERVLEGGGVGEKEVGLGMGQEVRRGAGL